MCVGVLVIIQWSFLNITLISVPKELTLHSEVPSSLDIPGKEITTISWKLAGMVAKAVTFFLLFRNKLCEVQDFYFNT